MCDRLHFHEKREREKRGTNSPLLKWIRDSKAHVSVLSSIGIVAQCLYAMDTASWWTLNSGVAHTTRPDFGNLEPLRPGVRDCELERPSRSSTLQASSAALVLRVCQARPNYRRCTTHAICQSCSLLRSRADPLRSDIERERYLRQKR